MVPTKETRICSKCGDNKLIGDFSLVRGRHSTERKSYCVTCETLGRKARKQYDIDLDTYKALLKRPCSICGCEAKHIDKQDKRIHGVLCKRCFTFLKSIKFEHDDDTLQRCKNYLVFRNRFSFWLKMLMSQDIPEPETPLFDGLIDD